MKPSLQLFNYTVLNQGSGTVDIHIDGEIVDAPTQQLLKEWFNDETSTSYKSFRNQVEAASPKVVNVYINSPGGMVSDAMAIHDYLWSLEEKGVTVNRKGIGIVASAATYLLIGKNSEMSENSMMMIHNLSMVVYGDINQIENQYKAGRKYNDLIVDFYATHTGKPPETIAAWMNKETWMTAAEAKERGFVKNITGQAKFKNAIPKEKWPFENTSVLNTYNSFTQNTDDMKIDLATIKAAVKNALVELGFKKEDDKDDVKLDAAVDKISNAIAAPLKPLEGLNESITNTVTAAVTNAMKDLKVEISNVQGLDQKITDAVKEATKDFATNKKVTDLQDSIVQKLGGKKEEKPETDEERKITNKHDFYRVGKFEKAAV